MSRKNPHLNDEGQPKLAYRTAAAGWAHIAHLVETGRVAEGLLRSYPCKVCDRHHIGKLVTRTQPRRRSQGAW